MKRVVVGAALFAAVVLTGRVKVSTAADPALVGQWSAVLPWSAIAVHSHLLNTGRVVNWERGSQANVWDPATGSFAAVPNPWADLLCAGHTFLSDGRLITLGGWDRSGAALGLNEVDIFDPNTQAWIRARPMAFKRWYPTATRLPDGRILSVSGSRNSLSDVVNVPEVYDPATDTWTTLTAATNAIPLYPFLFVLPDGGVIWVGNSEVASRTQVLNLSTLTWTIVDNRLIDGGSAVMFQPGKFLKAGTAADSGNSGLAAPTAFVLDMTQPAPAWQPTGSMAFPRSFHNLTMLPDGTALVTGGGTDRSAFDTANAILAAEVWSPATGIWTTLASMVTPRLYHSTALLLPDARVLVAGGGADSGVADQPTAEIFSPPYLFKGPRPTIASVPSTLAYGSSFTVATPDNASIASVAFVAPGSVTHAFDENQTFQTLAFSSTADGLTVTAPANANLAPPGSYMLFIVNSSGVPSVAAFVNLMGNPPATVAVPNVVDATQAAATTTITNAGLAVGVVTTASSATVPAGSVISQSPVAGTLVAMGSAVSLVVSSGTGLIAVPNVVNATQAAAMTTITNAGLTVGAVTTASSATVPAGSVISQTPTGGAQVASGSAVALVVSSGPAGTPSALTVDTMVFVDGRGTLISPLITTTAAGDLLVAFVASDGPAAGATQTVTVSGAGLTWTLNQRSNTQFGTSEIWTATAPTALTNASVTATQAFNGFDQSLTVVAFRGAGGTGAAGAAGAPGGAPSVSLTTTRAGSLVYGVGNDWDGAIGRVVGTSQTMVHQWIDTGVGDTFWVQAGSGPVAAAGAIATIDDTSPTTHQWNLAAIEILASAPPQVAVPNVVGLTQATATTAITGANLTVGAVTNESSTTVPAGSVISQSPIADTQVATGTAVALVVSSGPQVAVPNVVGLTEAAATSAITGANLVVGAVTNASSTTVPAGSVISQSPVADTQVATGTAVALVVSSGPPVAVPNVVGLTQADATAAITSVNLTVGAVTNDSSTTVPAGSVVSQSPIADTQVATGSAVALVVSSGPPQIAVPNVIGLTQAAATTAITGANLTVGAVTDESSTTVPAGTVISQTPLAGVSVAPGSEVALVVSSGPPPPSLDVDTVVFSDGIGTRMTSPFSTAAAGELLVAFVASDGSNNGNQGQTVTVSGAGLAWSLVTRANTQSGTAEIWTATAPAKLVDATVRATQSNGGGLGQSLTVIAFIGAGGIGASVASSGNRTAPSVSLTTTAAGSLVFGVGNDPERRTSRTPDAGQTIVHQWLDSNSNATYWVQTRSAPTGPAGSIVKISDAATNSRWNLAAVEIVAR
jgi:beta-lactam-binding protein with PASTA domain